MRKLRLREMLAAAVQVFHFITEWWEGHLRRQARHSSHLQVRAAGLDARGVLADPVFGPSWACNVQPSFLGQR